VDESLLPTEHATPQQVMAALQKIPHENSAELVAALHDYYARIAMFSVKEITAIINASPQIYLAFTARSIWDKSPAKIRDVIVEATSTWLEKKEFNAFRRKIPDYVIFFAYLLYKNPSNAVIDLSIEYMSEALLKPDLEKKVRDRFLFRLSMFPVEAIKRCLQHKVFEPNSPEFRCLLGEVCDEDFSRLPTIKRAINEIKIAPLGVVIENRELADLDAHLNYLDPQNPDHLEQLQTLIRRFVVIIEAGNLSPVAKNDYENMLEKCLIHLMNFSTFGGGLKLEAGLLRKCLAIINAYVFVGNMTKFLNTLGPDHYSMLSYIRRTVRNFEAMLILQDIIFEHNIYDYTRCSAEYLEEAIKKGYFDVQAALIGIVINVAQTKVYAKWLVEVLGANVDVEQEGLSFFGMALFEAGKERGVNVAALDFYIQHKMKVLGDATRVLAAVIEKCTASSNGAYYYALNQRTRGMGVEFYNMKYADYYRGCVYAITQLMSKYGAKPTEEVVEKVSNSDMWSSCKQSVIAALTSTHSDKPRVTELPEHPHDPYESLNPFSRAMVQAGGNLDDGAKQLGFFIRARIPAFSATRLLETVVELCVTYTKLADYYRGCVLATQQLICKYGAKSTVEMAIRIKNSDIPEHWKESMMQTLRLASEFNPFEISGALERLSEMLAHPTREAENVNDLIKKIGRAVIYLSPAEKKKLSYCELTAESRELLQRSLAVNAIVEINARNLSPRKKVVSVSEEKLSPRAK
jgi:hypothetical protein